MKKLIQLTLLLPGIVFGQHHQSFLDLTPETAYRFIASNKLTGAMIRSLVPHLDFQLAGAGRQGSPDTSFTLLNCDTTGAVDCGPALRATVGSMSSGGSLMFPKGGTI